MGLTNNSRKGHYISEFVLIGMIMLLGSIVGLSYYSNSLGDLMMENRANTLYTSTARTEISNPEKQIIQGTNDSSPSSEKSGRY